MSGRDRVAAIVRERLGLVFPEARAHALDAGIARAAQSLELSGVEALVDKADDQQVLDALAVELTIGETYFFRDPAHFEALRARVLRPLRGKHVRLWSAGCATGEEPYSLAIAGLEEGVDVEVIATDLNPRFLRRASAGLYGPWSFRGVSDATKHAWFTEDARRLRVRDVVRERVRFSSFNLVSGAEPPTNVDAVFCRNVLIYFDETAIAAATDALARSLVVGGFLFAGPSDPMLVSDRLRVETSPQLILYQRVEPGAVEVMPESAPPVSVERPVPVEPPKTKTKSRTAASTSTIASPAPRLDPETYVAEANARLDRGDDRGALDSLRAALLLDRALAIAHLLSVGPLRRLGDEKAARRALLKARSALAEKDDAAIVGGRSVSEMRALLEALERAGRRR
jgi:chemotaxis protein methyltransferase CheR